MSVLIKNMMMPKNCGKCEFMTEGLYQGKHYPCICSVGKFLIKPSETDLRDGLCPLVEVRQPHGRLIDADALDYKLGVSDYDIYVHDTLEEDAPTVIEAEE